MHAQCGCSNVCGRKERDRKGGGTEGGNVVQESREACSHSVLLFLAPVCRRKRKYLTESKLIKTTHACHFHHYADEEMKAQRG